MRALPLALLLTCACSFGSAGCGALGTRPASTPEVSLPRGSKLLPARTRRLTNLEVERAVQALTGLEVAVAKELPPDVRQEGYTPNVKQDVSTTWATRYGALIAALSARAARQRATLVGCRDLGDAACRHEVVAQLGLQAFRRPLAEDEQRSLENLLLEAGQDGARFEEQLS